MVRADCKGDLFRGYAGDGTGGGGEEDGAGFFSGGFVPKKMAKREAGNIRLPLLASTYS